MLSDKKHFSKNWRLNARIRTFWQEWKPFDQSRSPASSEEALGQEWKPPKSGGLVLKQELKFSQIYNSKELPYVIMYWSLDTYFDTSSHTTRLYSPFFNIWMLTFWYKTVRIFLTILLLLFCTDMFTAMSSLVSKIWKYLKSVRMTVQVGLCKMGRKIEEFLPIYLNSPPTRYFLCKPWNYVRLFYTEDFRLVRVERIVCV